MKTTLKIFSVALVIVLSIFSCKQEEILTVNEEATRPFQDSSTIVINGGNTGNSGGGNNGGSSGGSAEFFEFKVDGTTIQGVNPEYRTGFGNSANIASHFSTTTNLLQLAFFSAPTTTGVRALLVSDASFSFDIQSNVNYSPIDGELDITELSNDKIAGTFFFRATPFVNGGDTISITEGRFSVNK